MKNQALFNCYYILIVLERDPFKPQRELSETRNERKMLIIRTSGYSKRDSSLSSE